MKACKDWYVELKRYCFYFWLLIFFVTFYISFLLRDHNANKAFCFFVLSLPFSFFFYRLLAIVFFFTLKFVRIVLKKFCLLIFYIICIALTYVTTSTNFWHLIIYLFMEKYNFITYSEPFNKKSTSKTWKAYWFEKWYFPQGLL